MLPQDADLRAWLESLSAVLPLEVGAADAFSLHEAWLSARAAHPQIAVAAEPFFAFLAARIPHQHFVAELSRRKLADLYLACGCARADAAALAAFEALTVPAIERALASLRLAEDARRELLQMLREQMLVARTTAPGIAGYDGRAPLAVWLRVCATRLSLRQTGQERRLVHEADDRLEQLAPGVQDPELSYMKHHYSAEFQSAFTGAVAGLSARERNLLRHTVIDGLGIDQIAAIYHMHRATAARQLQRARTALADGTRARLRAALRVSERELESILRVVMSRGNLSLRRALADRPRGG